MAGLPTRVSLGQPSIRPLFLPPAAPQASQPPPPRSAAEKWGRSSLLPATMLVLGIVSMVLLIWIRRIDERQVTHFALANVVMDLRIQAGSSHLWTEEAVAGGGRTPEATRAMSDLGKAMGLCEVLLQGGESEDGLFAPPLEVPELRARAANIRQLLSDWSAISRQRLTSPERGGEGSALEARSDQLADELQRKAGELEGLIEADVAYDILRSRRLYYGVLVAWSCVVAASTAALGRRERRRRDMEEALRTAKSEVDLKVLERTTELRQLSARLLTAQETERKRISSELHDQLGHSLIMVKLRSGLIAKGLGDDRSPVKVECETLSGLIDKTIEDVRRLSRDLRPTVLEELGLSTALRWLVDNCGLNGVTVTASIGNVDAHVSPNAQVVVYRIIQQALTNAGQHSHARRVSLVVTTCGQTLSFVVEDDGRGFDVRQADPRNAGERGLGLATMQERAWMLGGSLSLWSEREKGTRIALEIPVWNGEA